MNAQVALADLEQKVTSELVISAFGSMGHRDNRIIIEVCSKFVEDFTGAEDGASFDAVYQGAKGGNREKWVTKTCGKILNNLEIDRLLERFKGLSKEEKKVFLRKVKEMLQVH
jgi:hypothetical protein